MRKTFGGEDVTYEDLAPRKVRASGVGGPLRLEPMLDAAGDLLPAQTRPRRPVPAGAAPGTYLDGSPAQFLERYAPFPAGVSPHALAYDHFMKALVLQDYGGQRHVQKSVDFIDANPGRALRDWSISTFEEGRLLEAEAFGREAIAPGESGERQAALERSAADVPLTATPVSRKLLERAVQRYERSVSVGRDAAASLGDHLRRVPSDNATFGAAIRRLDALRPLLEADVIYDKLILGDAGENPANNAAARREAAALYRDADGRLRDYLLLYHTPGEWLPGDLMPSGSLDLPAADKDALIDRLRGVAAADPQFVHARAVAEFEGYLQRIRARLALLDGDRSAA